MALTPRMRSALRWTGIVLGVLVVIVVLTLALIDGDSMKGPIERYASAKAGRTVSIGKLEVHAWSWTPSATVEGLKVGNPKWEKARRPMAQVERLNVQLKLLPLLKGDVILPRVELIRPTLYLHRDASGRTNWSFEIERPTNAPAEPPPDLPTVRDFLIQGGKLTVRDDIRRLNVDGVVQARENSTKDDPEAFRIQAKGTINRQRFESRVTGGPLVNLDPDKPYPFGLDVEAGDIRIAADGTVRKPFDLARVKLNVRASGGDLADLYYLTQLAFPNTPPFQLSATVERNGSKVHVTNLAGKTGRSDVSGDLTVDRSRKRPFVSGHIDSTQLYLSDLVAPLGGRPKIAGALQGAPEAERPSKKGVEEAPPAAADARLFPVARLQVNRVRAMDGDVKFRAQSIHAGSLPMKEVAFDIKLNEGVLALAPFEFELPQGLLTGTAHIDARGKVPHTRLDVRMKDLQLDQLKGRKPGSQPPLGGVLQARAVLEGDGDSVHDFMANGNGRVSLVLPKGEVRAAFAELTGINVARGVGLLLKGDNEKATIRCGVAQFAVLNGKMQAQNVVFDTEDVRITGRGEVRLGPEELDLSLKGEPKKLRLARLRSPVEIGGHLRKPAFGIDAGETAKQGAIAAALGVVTPVAAVLAFIDPGLAKDENCAELLSTAQAASTTEAPALR
jgi:AsmA family protein